MPGRNKLSAVIGSDRKDSRRDLLKHFRMGFRGDIEGLRALAILLVVANHAGVSWFSGGYVGVDVFFVLSGYLITGLLLEEVGSTGRLRLAAFYARRLRRLLPALLFMVFGTAVFAAVLLAPAEQFPQAVTAMVTSVWVSNFFFGFSNFDYFSPDSESNLFLHTWSLGVEEQFYLVWPALLMFLLGAWHWQGKRQNLRRLIFGMSAIVVCCFLLTVWLSYTEPLWAFYMMPARAWQFALGALAVLWSSKKSGNARRDTSSAATRVFAFIGWAGIALIVAAGVFLDSKMVYPGAWAALPSLGAMFVLISGSSGTSTSAARVLSIRPMLAIGRVSYSWYLWHWPVLILGGVVLGSGNPYYQAALVGLSLVLAIISYVAIESPIRHHRLLVRRPVLTLRLAVVSTVSAIVITLVWQSAAISWVQQPEQRIYQEVRSELPVIYSMGCDEWFYSAEVRVCQFGESNAEKVAMLIGDSVIGQWFPAIASAYTKRGWRLSVITKSACPMVEEPIFYKRIGMEYTVCSEWRSSVLAKIADIKPDVVFVGGSSSYTFTEDQWISGTTRMLDRMAPAARQVFIIHGTHRLPFDGPDCLARRSWQPGFLARRIDCSAMVDDRSGAGILVWLKNAAESFDNVAVLDFNTLICPGGRCYAERDNLIVYRDFQHLSVRYVQGIADKVADVIAVSGSTPVP